MYENVKHIEGLIEVNSEAMTREELAKLYPHENVVVEVLERDKYNEISLLKVKYRGNKGFNKYVELCRQGYDNYRIIYTTPKEDSILGKLFKEVYGES